MLILLSLMPYLVISCLVSIATHVAGDIMLLANVKSDPGNYSNGSIYVSNIATNDQQIIRLDFTPIPLASVRNPIAVDYDANEGLMYWVDFTAGTISRAYLNGSQQQVVVSGLQAPTGLSFDPMSSKIYFTEEGRQRIGVVNNNGTNMQIIVDNLQHKPRPIIVHHNSRSIYWAEWDDSEEGRGSLIQRADLDGRHVTPVIQSDLQYPNGLTIHYDCLYWCDSGFNRIEKSSLTGRHRQVLFSTDNNIHPFDVAIYKDHIYWSDWSQDFLSGENISEQYADVSRQVHMARPAAFHMASGIAISRDDKIPPAALCPDDITLTTDINSNGTSVAFQQPTATDNSDNVTVLQVTTVAAKLLANETTVDIHRMKQVQFVVTISVWTVLAASVLAVSLLIIIFTLMYNKICCTSKLKSIYESSLLEPEDKSQYVMYQTVAEKKTDDYATTLELKTQNDVIHNLDNPGYISKDGIAGLHPQYTNLLPKEENHQLLGVEPPSQVAFIVELNHPPHPPSVNKLNTLVQMQKTF